MIFTFTPSIICNNNLSSRNKMKKTISGWTQFAQNNIPYLKSEFLCNKKRFPLELQMKFHQMIVYDKRIRLKLFQNRNYVTSNAHSVSHTRALTRKHSEAHPHTRARLSRWRCFDFEEFIDQYLLNPTFWKTLSAKWLSEILKRKKASRNWTASSRITVILMGKIFTVTRRMSNTCTRPFFT